jgi:O-antigen/teichoic acid export membrane protein
MLDPSYDHGTIAHALKWSGVSKACRQILQFLVSLIMIRLLTPTDFGLVGIVAVFFNFAFLLSELGFGSAIIQRKQLTDSHLNSAFWLNVLVGLFFMFLFLAISPAIAALYNAPVLKPLVSLISINFLVCSLGVVNCALLRRSMRFREIALMDIVSSVSSGTVSIYLALRGWGVWSLAAQNITFQCLQTLLSWRFYQWRPKLLFNRESLRDLIGFGLNLTGFNFFNYWVRNADNFLIGKIVGPHALGIYSKAYTTMTTPVLQVTDLIANVMFPALSSIQHDKERVKDMYLRIIRSIAFVTFPLMIGLLVTADQFVRLVFGPHWLEVIPVLRILCVIGIIQGVSSSTGLIFTALGRTDLMFKWGVFSGSVYIASFIVGIRWGITGVALSYVFSGYMLLWYPAWTIPGRLINLGFMEMLRNVAGPFLCSCIMAVCILTLPHVLHGFCSSPIVLLLQTAWGLMIYTLLGRYLHLRAYREILDFLRGGHRAG